MQNRIQIGYVQVLPFAVVELMNQNGRLSDIATFHRFPSAPRLEAALEGGTIDVGFMGILPAYDLIARSTPVSIVATTTFQGSSLYRSFVPTEVPDSSLDGAAKLRLLCSTLASELKRPASFATLSAQSVSNGILHDFLNRAEISPSSVIIHNVPEADLTDLALRGKADFVLTREPIVSEVRTKGGVFDLVLKSDELYPGKIPGIMAVRREVSQKVTEKLQACVTELVRCVAEINTAPREAAAQISKGGKMYSADDLMSQHYSADPSSIGNDSAQLRDTMVRLGCISPNTLSIQLADFIDPIPHERAVHRGRTQNQREYPRS